MTSVAIVCPRAMPMEMAREREKKKKNANMSIETWLAFVDRNNVVNFVAFCSRSNNTQSAICSFSGAFHFNFRSALTSLFHLKTTTTTSAAAVVMHC